MLRMEEDPIIELNKTALRDLFSRKLCEKDVKFISHRTFFKFICTLKIYPDLISSFDLKRILNSILKKKASDERTCEITYPQFEKLLLSISEHCFPTGESFKLLVTHIKSMCQLLYHTTLHTKVNSVMKESTLRENLKILQNTRIKNASNTQRKILNKSTSQKLSLSGLISPKTNVTVLKKAFDFRSPSLKMLANKKKPEEEGKMTKISSIFENFKKNHQKIVAGEKIQKKHAIYFIEKMLNDKLRNVRFS